MKAPLWSPTRAAIAACILGGLRVRQMPELIGCTEAGVRGHIDIIRRTVRCQCMGRGELLLKLYADTTLPKPSPELAARIEALRALNTRKRGSPRVRATAERALKRVACERGPNSVFALVTAPREFKLSSKWGGL